MDAYLLDTNILIDAINARRGKKEALLRLLLAGKRLCCSTVTVLEIFAGLRPEEEGVADLVLSQLELIDVSREIATLAGKAKYAFARKGVTLSVPDAMIAATAMTHTMVLFTDNRRDFPMPELVFHEEA